MNQPEPVLTAHLFPEILHALLDLLKDFSLEDWQKPTVCSGWSVQDVALHLLGGEVGNLSRRRDEHVLPADIDGWDSLVRFINDWNQDWVRVTRRISPRLLTDLLALTGEGMCAYFQGLDPFALGGPVNWAGSGPAPVWLDLAREYTERWHHQQHIRDAVNRPGLMEPRYLAPALAAFMFALPQAFQGTAADQGTGVTVTLRGDAGGRWTVLREGEAWIFYSGAPGQPDAEVVLPQDLAWRLFTRGVSASDAQGQILINGDCELGLKVLDMVSIIA